MSRPILGIGVPMVVQFGPADTGRRVTLRRRLPDTEPGEPRLSDVVGILEAWSDDVLAVRNRRGELIEISASSLAAGRVVAPEVAAADLCRFAADAWRARETARLGEWQLRAHGGVTHRPNSALAVGDPGMPIDEAAASVRDWYSARDLPATVMTPVPSPVADTYRALGWQQESLTLVMAARLADVVEHIDRLDAVPPVVVEVTEELPDDWRAVLARLRDVAVAPLFRELLTGTPTASFATARDEHGEPVAVARGAITSGWLNLTNVEVVESARGRRLAGAVVEAVVRWAVQQHATDAYLELWPDNTAALRLYERLGFVRHHEYAYFVDPRT